MFCVLEEMIPAQLSLFEMDIPTEQRSHQLNFSFDQLEKLSHKIPKLKVALYLYIPTYKEITIWRYQILYFTI